LPLFRQYAQKSRRLCGKSGCADSSAAFGAAELRMTPISGFERSQLLLLPEAVDDYGGADNPMRFIDAFVDELDLAAAGFNHVEAKATGRPGYAPVDFLKLYIYGYLNRVRSNRRLEMERRRNFEVIWLLRSLKPDFKTIADFRRDNRSEISPNQAGQCTGPRVGRGRRLRSSTSWHSSLSVRLFEGHGIFGGRWTSRLWHGGNAWVHAKHQR
jgi:transposase